MIYVIKADGRKEEFIPRKIVKTCLRSGASRQKAEEIADKIGHRVRNGWTTHRIYQMILAELDKIKDHSSFLFRLREAIAKIEPDKFEIYSKKVLEAHGYKCEWNRLIKGKSVEHQVDVIAKKDKLYLVETKHHINHHRFCGLGVILQVQARLEDIIDGFNAGKNRYNFDIAWVFNNTKFSYHAKKYAKAKNITLTGWGYKGHHALEKLVQSKKIYPVSILKISPKLQKRLFDHNMITLHDIISSKKSRNILGKKYYQDVTGQIRTLTK